MIFTSNEYVDTFQYLELNELEKCQLVNRYWYFNINDSKIYYNRARRIHEVVMDCVYEYRYTSWNVKL